MKVFDMTNLSGIQKRIEEAAEKGVEAATQEAVEWIVGDVLEGQAYVGHQYFPDNSAATKRTKAKRGKTKVLIDTTNYKSSWDGKAEGLTGTITGGGGVGYAKDLYARGWQIDNLFMDVHAKVSEKIIKKAIEKAV